MRRLPAALIFICATVVAAQAQPRSQVQAPVQTAPRGSVITPANYKQATADAASQQLKNVTLAGAQISPLVPPHLTQLGDWVACLKTANGFFLMIADNGALSFRRAVVIDNCDRAAYGPLPRPKPRPAKPKDDDDDS